MKLVAQEEYPIDLVNAWDEPCTPGGRRITLWQILRGDYDIEYARRDFKEWSEMQSNDGETSE